MIVASKVYLWASASIAATFGIMFILFRISDILPLKEGEYYGVHDGTAGRKKMEYI